MAGQVRAILTEIKRRLGQDSGDSLADRPVDPQAAVFQADLMEGAARAVGRLADVLAGRMQEQAQALQKKAAAAAKAIEPEDDAIRANIREFSNEAMPFISHRLNGTGRQQDDNSSNSNYAAL